MITHCQICGDAVPEGLGRAVVTEDGTRDWLCFDCINNLCPAGGVHEWAVQEEWGTGRTGVACDNCGAAPPERRRKP